MLASALLTVPSAAEMRISLGAAAPRLRVPAQKINAETESVLKKHNWGRWTRNDIKFYPANAEWPDRPEIDWGIEFGYEGGTLKELVANTIKEGNYKPEKPVISVSGWEIYGLKRNEKYSKKIELIYIMRLKKLPEGQALRFVFSCPKDTYNKNVKIFYEVLKAAAKILKQGVEIYTINPQPEKVWKIIEAVSPKMEVVLKKSQWQKYEREEDKDEDEEDKGVYYSPKTEKGVVYIMLPAEYSYTVPLKDFYIAYERRFGSKKAEPVAAIEGWEIYATEKTYENGTINLYYRMKPKKMPEGSSIIMAFRAKNKESMGKNIGVLKEVLETLPPEQ